MAEYKNPWFRSSRDSSPTFKTDVRPTEYRGYQIFHRGGGWDVVKDGVCRTQRVGLSGAKGYVDAVLDHDDQCDCNFCSINRIHRPELHAA